MFYFYVLCRCDHHSGPPWQGGTVTVRDWCDCDWRWRLDPHTRIRHRECIYIYEHFWSWLLLDLESRSFKSFFFKSNTALITSILSQTFKRLSLFSLCKVCESNIQTFISEIQTFLKYSVNSQLNAPCPGEQWNRMTVAGKSSYFIPPQAVGKWNYNN